MEVLLLLPIGFVGSVFWFVSAELSAVAYGAEGYHPLLVGALAALGQCSMYVILYFGGTKLVERWAWLQKSVAKLEDRYHERLQAGYLSASGVASVLGIPPMVALITLASGFHVRFVHIWPLALAGRFIRFTILAAVGTELIAWWNSFSGCA